MEQSWIVGIDGSAAAQHALSWAAGFAAACSDRVQPVLTWEVPLPIWATDGMRAIDIDRPGLAATAAVAARDALDRCVLTEQERSVVDDPIVTEGHASRLLLEWSEAGHPLVVGRRGVGALRHRLLGSTSSYLATHASSPVIVVPERSERPAVPRHVVVGFDGSDHAVRALEWALEALPGDTEIEVVGGIDVVPWFEPGFTGLAASGQVAALEAESQRLHEAIGRIDAGERVRRSIEMDGPHRLLRDRFTVADLVVVGPRGRGALARAILGSVTAWLLNEAPCPVAVIPGPAR